MSQNGIVCNLADKMFKKVIYGAINYFTYLDLFKTINVYDIQEDHICTDPAKKDKLYALKLENNSLFINERSTLNNLKDIIGKNSGLNADENKIMISYVKNNKKQAIFLHSYNKEIIKYIANYFSIKMMTGHEVVDSLFDIFNIGKYIIKDNKLIKAGELVIKDDTQNISTSVNLSPFSIDIKNYKFKKIVQMAVDKIWQNYTIYQGTFYAINEIFIPSKLFQVDWEGSLFVWINFSGKAAKYLIKRNYDIASYGDTKMIGILKDLVKAEDSAEIEEILENEYCIINSALYLNKKESLSQIQNAVKIQYEENMLTSPKIISKTLLEHRDPDFDEVVPIKYTQKFFSTMHKQDSEDPDFWVRDINNAITNISLADNANPHFFIGGITGGGKSVTMLKLLMMFLKIDKNNFYSQELNSGDTMVRYSDVGYTAGTIIKNLKYSQPEKIKILKSNIGRQKFSIFDVDVDTYGVPLQDDLEFVVNLTNIAIEAIEKESTLKALEQSFFKRVFTDIIRSNKYINYSLEEIRRFGFEDEVNYFYSKGYSQYTTINDVHTEKQTEEMFKKPTLELFIKELNLLSKAPDTKEGDRETIDNLINKVKILESYNIFNNFSNVSFDSKIPFYYIDFDAIKDDKKMFIVVFWLLFKKWITVDKKAAIEKINKNEKRPKIYYVIEEAHNFFGIPSFAEFLKTVTKELRKFGGRLVFISQRFDDIPDNILGELGMKIFVFKEGQKAEAKHSIVEKFKIDEKVQDLFDQVEGKNRIAYISTNRGVTLCDFPLEDGELEYYLPLSDI